MRRPSQSEMEGCDTTRECFNAEVIEGELVAHDGSEDMSSSGGTEGTPIGLQQAGKDVDEVVAEVELHRKEVNMGNAI